MRATKDCLYLCVMRCNTVVEVYEFLGGIIVKRETRRLYRRVLVEHSKLGLMFCPDPRFGTPTKQWAFDQFNVRPHEVFKFRPPGGIRIFNNGSDAVRQEGLEWIQLLVQKHVPILAIVQHGDVCAAYGKQFPSVSKEIEFHKSELEKGLRLIRSNFKPSHIKIVAAIMVPEKDGIHTYATYPLSAFRP